jgi:choice-of-anchor A domain-containing protein/uncharacterized repeat protein (TIGR01451 family)
MALAIAAMAAEAREPSTARTAQTACADLSPASEFNTFVHGDHRINNNDVYGRMAVGGNAIFNDRQQGEVAIGNGLSQAPTRLDLIVGGDIVSPGNARVNRGSAVYTGTLTGSLGAAGSVTRIDEADLPFDFGDAFERLRSLQDTWADLPDQLHPVVLGAGGNHPRVRFVGTDDRLNVFTVSATTLQSARTLEIGVPNGTATTLINVTGNSYTSADLPTERIMFNVDDPVGDDFEQVGGGDFTSPKGIARGRLVWSFADADVVQIGSDEVAGNPSISWQGSVFAPRATVLLARSATVYGSVVALRVEQTGRARLPGIADACLPPPCEPTEPTDPTDPTEPTPEPEPEPPPLPPEPITPSPPGGSRPPAGAVGGAVSGSTALSLCKRPNRRRVPAGGRVTYRLEVRNTGLAPAQNVVVCDPVPVGLTIVRARGARVRGNRACWRFGRVRDERTMHLKARVNSTASGVIRNVARARATNATGVRAGRPIRVIGAAAFDPCPPGAAMARLVC